MHSDEQRAQAPELKKRLERHPLELGGMADAVAGRVRELADGTLKAPATDEVFMREYMKEWERLMTTQPKITLAR